MTKTKDLISKYIERVKIDYPEDDKLYIDLEQFGKEYSDAQNADLQAENERLKAQLTEQEETSRKDYGQVVTKYMDETHRNTKLRSLLDRMAKILKTTSVKDHIYRRAQELLTEYQKIKG